MTKSDLRLKYKNASGFYPIKGKPDSTHGELEDYLYEMKTEDGDKITDAKDLLPYTEWLEEEIIKLRKLIPWEK
jgi:hypothetical protein